MALKKIITLRDTTTGSYIRLDGFRWNRTARDASADFVLFATPAAAEAGATPLLNGAVIAVLRLSGAKFDQYLSNEALGGHEIAEQLYAAAKAEPALLDAGGGLTAITFADAEDV